MAVPIIMPMPVTQKRDCIVQEGIRYCESNPLTKHDLGWMSVIMLVVILWFGFWAWLGIEKDWGMWAMAICFLVPFALGSLLLFL